MPQIEPMQEAPEPRRAAFREKPLNFEPNSDVQLVLDDGMILRERVIRTPTGEGLSLLFTYTRLDNNGNVITDINNKPMIFSGHEIALTGENLGKSSMEDIQESIKQQREVGAARAQDYFKGLDKMSDILTSRF